LESLLSGALSTPSIAAAPGDDSRDVLRGAFAEANRNWPFEMPVVVLLPDHLHTIWALPSGDDRYATRWGWIKKEFTKHWLAAGGCEQPVSAAKQRACRRGIWQRRYWEHLIRDEHDFERHFDYIHYNPVKHGYVKCPKDWPYSSFHRWVNKGGPLEAIGPLSFYWCDADWSAQRTLPCWLLRKQVGIRDHQCRWGPLARRSFSRCGTVLRADFQPFRSLLSGLP
jgi:putative transposase